LGISAQFFKLLGGHADFLHPFISSRVSGVMQFHDGSVKETASNFVQISESVQRRP
jgi:hypothetical protein